jgi:nonsense-mediated mRNA decay protein 3
MDYEHFLQELEEDPEMRSQISLYKAPDAERIYRQSKEDRMVDDEDEEEEEVPEVKLEELLEDLTLEDNDIEVE